MVSRYLADDESVVLQVRRHVTVLAKPFFQALGMIFLAILLGAWLSPNQDADAIDTALGLASLFFVLRFVWRLLEWRFDRIIVTDRRIFEVSGLLTKNVASMPLEKMTDMTYRRSVLGRLLGYGDVLVESAGQNQALAHIDHLPNPDEFYRSLTYLVTSGIMARSEPEATREATWTFHEGRGGDEDEDLDDTGPLPRVII